jgi:hypothetical protein
MVNIDPEVAASAADRERGSMRGILRRLRAAGLACVLVAGSGAVLAATSSVLMAGPALASNSCTDSTTAQPTAVHSAPSDSSPTTRYLNTGTAVHGICLYYSNASEGHWYMVVSFSDGGGYIWIQRLSIGQNHQCLDNGQVYGISPGSTHCPLDPAPS